MAALIVLCILVALLIGIFVQLDADFALFFSKPAGDFNDKIIWITGASSGIGASVACELISKGARVVMSARRADALQNVSDSCSGRYPPLIMPLDVTNLTAQKVALDTIIKKYGRIDSVILNAGK